MVPGQTGLKKNHGSRVTNGATHPLRGNPRIYIAVFIPLTHETTYFIL